MGIKKAEFYAYSKSEDEIEKSQQIEIAKMIHTYHKEQEDSDDWDDIPILTFLIF